MPSLQYVDKLQEPVPCTCSILVLAWQCISCAARSDLGLREGLYIVALSTKAFRMTLSVMYMLMSLASRT